MRVAGRPGGLIRENSRPQGSRRLSFEQPIAICDFREWSGVSVIVLERILESEVQIDELDG